METGYSVAAVSPLAAGALPVASLLSTVPADLFLLAFRVAAALTAAADRCAGVGFGLGASALIAVTVACGGAGSAVAVAGA